MVKFQEEKLKEEIEELRLKEEEDVTMMLADKYGIPYIDLTGIPINTDALQLIPEDIARGALLAAFKIVGQKLFVAAASPKNERAQAVVADLEKRGYKISLHLVSRHNLEKAWGRYKEIKIVEKTRAGLLNVATEKLEEFALKVKTMDDLRGLISEVVVSDQQYMRTSRVFEVILAGGIAINASDIHIEPEHDMVRLRFRLDGVLQDILDFDFATHKRLLSRIKLISGLKLNITQQAQDGRFSISIGKDRTEIEIRTSIIPGGYGESVVIRILNPEAISIELEDLGMQPYLLNIIDREIQKPTGMILNTGPTGSGKSTSLYAFLKKIYTPGVKIITVEDPIEYHLEGIVQTQVNPKAGYDFLNGLRSILRQDPDVIMVGEIRDPETAKIAVNAALTGHIVFSTLHTNNAAGAIPRLIDLEVDPTVISSAINIAIAQRLVRRLCEKCKKEDTQTADERTLLDEIVQKIKKKKFDITNHGKIWRATGCLDCFHTGYAGRIAVYEAVLVTEEIDEIIYRKPSAAEIKRAAEYQNILDLREDGIVRILTGSTSLPELE
ncbi:type II/IV secretion system protein, partial [bacterium]|nr:type II/IV secretion system protein [bacterium]